MDINAPLLFDSFETLRQLRVLHTADWHLGKCLCEQTRDDEHQAFLDWIFDTIVQHGIELLVVAGDIFDSSNPPHTATTMLYQFLTRLHQSTDCEVVLVGGNHDSAKLLESVAPLLKTHRVHVVGSLKEDFRDCVFTIGKPEPKIVVVAIPYLRDRDVRTSVPGETADQIREGLVRGIADVYSQVAEYAKEIASGQMPILATGHLTTLGSQSSDSERLIHIGGLGAFPSSHFPADFQYIALGHLHRPQSADSKGRVRYSGSPIALSFSESDDVKSVELLEFDGAQTPKRLTIPVPVFRDIVSITCDANEVIDLLKLKEWDVKPLGCWVDLTLLNANSESPKIENVRAVIDTPHVTLLNMRSISGIVALSPIEDTSMSASAAIQFLRNEPRNIFLKRIESEVYSEELRQALLVEFDQLVEQVLSKDDHNS